MGFSDTCRRCYTPSDAESTTFKRRTMLNSGLDCSNLFHRSLSQPAPSLVPSVPRLYRALDDTEQPIAFLSVFHASWDKPIFNARLDGISDIVLAKVADPSRAYGAAVHQFLADNAFAPKLFGKCTLDGRPTLYVM